MLCVMKPSAFGPLPERRWDSGDHEGREFAGPGPQPPESLWADIGNGLEDEVEQWAGATRWGAGLLYADLSGPAAAQILTAAVNDVSALMRHVDHCDGRSAAWAARALFEHLVNALDVHASAAAGERYLRHRHVTDDRVSRRRWYFQLLGRKSQRRERERLTRPGKRAAGPLAKAIAQYGSSFARGWASDSLRDRAAKHALADGYEGYRILSGVIHGSSGATAGIVKRVCDVEVHRIGLDLDLAATAYAEGLRAFYEYAEHLVQVTGRPEAEEIRDRTANLLWRLEDVRGTLGRIDRCLWPKTPAPPPLAVLAVYPTGRQRWYLYRPQDESITLANAPRQPLPAGQAQSVADLVEWAKDYRPGEYGGRPMSIVLAGVRVHPRRDAQPYPAGSVLVPGGHPAMLAKPRAITLPASPGPATSSP